MNEQSQLSNQTTKPWYKRLKFIVTLAFIIIATGVAASIINKDKGEIVDEENKLSKNVETMLLAEEQGVDSVIETVGTVNAETQVEVVATTMGTLRSVYFEVGDDVYLNKTLAYLYDSTNLTSLNNARTNLVNTRSNLNSTERLSSETIRQAELGIEAAEEAVVAAEISLNNSNTNLENARALKTKGNEDIKNNAVTSFAGLLNTVDSALDKINSVIDAENNEELQIPNIQPVLGVKDSSSVSQAKSDYNLAKTSYTNLLGLVPDTTSITTDMEQMIMVLADLLQAVNSTVHVLDNTITNINFTNTTLNAQKNAFSALKDQIVGKQTVSKNTLYSLENQGLFYNQEIDALENAVVAANNRLASANIGLTNAIASMDNALLGRDQQILNSESAVDNAQGQLNLAQTQAANLTIKAPIAGTITGKYVEVGAEVSPGQRIAQVSQTDMLKIEISLISGDIYRVKMGQEVELGNGLKGTISSINPAADPITKKVSVEILFNNKDKNLIQGTFIDVKIPVEALEKTEATSIYIPLRAITITQNENFVFVANGDQAKKITVSIGNTEGALVEVVSGLAKEDILIIEGNKNLENGDKINIKQ